MILPAGASATHGLSAVLDADVGTLALRAELDLAPGSCTAVLGPNGAGKTTLLRVLAGLVPLSSGRLVVRGRVLDDPATAEFVQPEQRRVALVPQDHLLFDHMSVLDNVAFGLRSRGTGRSEARRRAGDWLYRVGLGAVAGRRPAVLSGGQSQRVALARALVTEPEVLLLDEPLAALDASVRPAVRAELRHWLADFAGVSVLVTHDPLDAWAVAQSLVVVEEGRVTQSGALPEVTARPRSPYVADLVGTNLLSGEARGHEVDVRGASVFVADSASGAVFVTVAPAAVSLAGRTAGSHPPPGSQRNHWPLEVASVEPVGERSRVTLVGVVELVAEVTRVAASELDLRPGCPVWASAKATEVACYPR